MLRKSAILLCILATLIAGATREAEAQPTKQPSPFTAAWLTLMQWTRVTSVTPDRASVERWTFSSDSTAVHWTTDATPPCLISASRSGCILRNGREAWFRWAAYSVGGEAQVCLTPTDGQPVGGETKPRPQLRPGEAGCHSVRFFNNQGLPEASAFLELDGDAHRFQSTLPVPTVDCQGEAIPAATTDFEPRCNGRRAGTSNADGPEVPIHAFETKAEAVSYRNSKGGFDDALRSVSGERPKSTCADCPRSVESLLAMKQQDSIRVLLVGRWRGSMKGQPFSLTLHRSGVAVVSPDAMPSAMQTFYWYVFGRPKSPGKFLFCEVDDDLVGYRTAADTVAFIPPSSGSVVLCDESVLTRAPGKHDVLAFGPRRMTRVKK